MNFYPEGYSVELAVPFVNNSDEPIVPVEITAVLMDGFDQVLVDFGIIPFVAEDGTKTILILDIYNALGEGEVRAARRLNVTMTTAAGPVHKTFAYAIEAEQSLIVMNNTFQSYEAATLLAMENVNTIGWQAADETRQRAALSAAYRRLTNIPMRYAFRDIDGVMSTDETYIARDEWALISADAFASFPTHFKRALRHAQFIEANELLQGDIVGQKHRSGIISESIGESKVTLRAGKIDYGIGSLTMAALVGYIHFNMRIARA